MFFRRSQKPHVPPILVKDPSFSRIVEEDNNVVNSIWVLRNFHLWRTNKALGTGNGCIYPFLPLCPNSLPLI